LKIFKEGTKLKYICKFYNNGEEIFYEVGRNCSEITVQMENGQMALVPWAKIIDYDKKIIMVNLALIDSVEIESDLDDSINCIKFESSK
jgi:hypothetical protein